MVVVVGVRVRVRSWGMPTSTSESSQKPKYKCVIAFVFQCFISFCEFDLHSNISVICKRRVHERVCTRAHLGHFINIL